MKKSQKTYLALSLIATLVAMGFHYYLTQKYFALKFSTAEGMSSCNINSFLNCDAVSASRFASFMGRPMALWGLVTNLVFFTLQLAVLWGWFAHQRQGQILAFLFATGLGFTSLIMGIISLTMLSQLCLYCIATYILSWISFAVWSLLVRPRFAEIVNFVKTLHKQKSSLGLLAAIPFFTWIFNTAFLDQHPGAANFERIVQERLAAWHLSAKVDFDLKTGLKMGSEVSSFTVVEFADFRCPHCRTAYPSLHAFAQAHPDTQLVFKPYPLDGTCNAEPAFEGKGDGISCRLALSVLCADKLEKRGWDLHHFLFDQQEYIRNISRLDDLDAKVCSAQIGDCQHMKDCMNSDEMMNELKAMIQEAIRANVKGTPAIYANGQSLPGGQILPVLEGAYLQSR